MRKQRKQSHYSFNAGLYERSYDLHMVLLSKITFIGIHHQGFETVNPSFQYTTNDDVSFLIASTLFL